MPLFIFHWTQYASEAGIYVQEKYYQINYLC